LPALRPLRRALSHRGLGHAALHPGNDPRGGGMPGPVTSSKAKAGPSTAPAAVVNDFVVKFANVNGSGSASANGMFAKSILRMGVPVAARNIFPSNIQGLPTWYEVRIS